MDQFVEICGARVSDSTIRIPCAVERWFDEPRMGAEQRIACIDQYRSAENTKLELLGDIPRRRRITLGAAKGDDVPAFVKQLRQDG